MDREKRAWTRSGRASVVRSQSAGSRPCSRSRKQPPTTYADWPPCQRVAMISATGAGIAGCGSGSSGALAASARLGTAAWPGSAVWPGSAPSGSGTRSRPAAPSISLVPPISAAQRPRSVPKEDVGAPALVTLIAQVWGEARVDVAARLDRLACQPQPRFVQEVPALVVVAGLARRHQVVP